MKTQFFTRLQFSSVKNSHLKSVALLLAAISASTLARANDSAIEGAGGTPAALDSIQKVQPLRGEHRSIRMQSETVEMTLGMRTYDVVANFVFHNDGAATTVLMGFPEGAGGDQDFEPLKKKSSYQKFSTSVDGKPIRARRIVAKTSDQFDFDSYWVKSVRFARGQTRRIRVAYRAPVGNSVGFDYIYYDFTGGNWKGKVDNSRLTLRIAAPGVYRLYPLEEQKSSAFSQSGSTLTWHWKNWQAQDGFAFRFGRTLPNIIMLANEEKDLNEPFEFFAGAREMIVHSPTGKPNVWNSHLTYTPDCIIRDGRAFISARGLADSIRNKISRRELAEKKEQRYGELVWDARTKSARLTIPGAIDKSLPDRVLSLRADTRSFQINGKNYALPAATFIAGDAAGQTLYLPLAPVISALHGTLKYNSITHHIWLDIPL